MSVSELWFFLIASVALLGSPGPAIAALLAVGRTEGWSRGLLYFGGLQVGLALAAGISVAGLFAAINLVPGSTLVMSGIATTYLIYLSYKIATSPVGGESGGTFISSSPFSGFLLGVTNPKAYFAFASLFASFEIISFSRHFDSLIKLLSVVIVMIVVDLIWLWIGVRLGRLELSHKSERILNYVLAASIVTAALVTLF